MPDRTSWQCFDKANSLFKRIVQLFRAPGDCCASRKCSNAERVAALVVTSGYSVYSHTAWQSEAAEASRVGETSTQLTARVSYGACLVFGLFSREV